jgi:hypothetical protein
MPSAQFPYSQKIGLLIGKFHLPQLPPPSAVSPSDDSPVWTCLGTMLQADITWNSKGRRIFGVLADMIHTTAQRPACDAIAWICSRYVSTPQGRFPCAVPDAHGPVCAPLRGRMVDCSHQRPPQQQEGSTHDKLSVPGSWKRRMTGSSSHQLADLVYSQSAGVPPSPA